MSSLFNGRPPASLQRMFFDGLDKVLPFGRYKGMKIREIIREEEDDGWDYILWCYSKGIIKPNDELGLMIKERVEHDIEIERRLQEELEPQEDDLPF